MLRFWLYATGVRVKSNLENPIQREHFDDSAMKSFILQNVIGSCYLSYNLLRGRVSDDICATLLKLNWDPLCGRINNDFYLG